MNKYFNFENLNTIFNYIFWFFVGNIYFLICNIPFIVYLLLFSFKSFQSSIVLLFMALLPLGPSITALLYVMGKLIRYKDISITKDFFSSYKNNFATSITTAFIYEILIFMLFFNITFFKATSYGSLLMPFFYISLLVIFCCITYSYTLIARFHISTINVLKNSLILCISNPLITLGNMIIFLFALAFIEIKASYAFLFLSSIVCFLLMFFQENLFKELQEKNKTSL